MPVITENDVFTCIGQVERNAYISCQVTQSGIIVNVRLSVERK